MNVTISNNPQYNYCLDLHPVGRRASTPLGIRQSWCMIRGMSGKVPPPGPRQVVLPGCSHVTDSETLLYGGCAMHRELFTFTWPIIFATSPMNDTAHLARSSTTVTFFKYTPSHCSFLPSIHSGPFGHSPLGVGHIGTDTFLNTASARWKGQPAPLSSTSKPELMVLATRKPWTVICPPGGNGPFAEIFKP